MSIEAQNKGIVLGVDHFVNSENSLVFLPELLVDPEIAPHITGLWVPKSQLDNTFVADEVSRIAVGSSQKFNSKMLGDGNTPPLTRAIFDTSSSGGVQDTLGHMAHILDKYPAQYSTFTLSLSAFAEVIEAAQEFAINRDGKKIGGKDRKIDFLLATAYPENDLEKLEEFTDMTPAEYTMHVSRIAAKYGMAGVVGAGDLAQHTLVGQPFLALGVSVAEETSCVVDTKYENVEQLKRLTNPEVTFRYATATEVQMGRSAFLDETGEVLSMSENETPEKKAKLSEIVKGNIITMIGRLTNLPKPIEIPEQLQLEI